MAAGLEGCGVEVSLQLLQPCDNLSFPFGSYLTTLKMMVKTALRCKTPIEPISPECFAHWDLILLAGPTFSYNPSGPVLSLLHRDGARLFQQQRVMPLISCRGYWRLHYWGLRRILRKKGARVSAPLVFTHTASEPWRTIGVFLRLVGKVPGFLNALLIRYYPKYGHSLQQVADARNLGRELGQTLVAGHDPMQVRYPKT